METNDLDVVYLLKQGSQGEELRYSLRSLINLPHRDVYVFGAKMPWFSDKVKVIPQVQFGTTKWERSNYSFISACKSKEVSDNFILMNDDFFVMQPCEKLEYFYDGQLKKRIIRLDKKFRYISSYSKMLSEVEELLKANNKPTLNYTLHIPMIFNKQKCLELKKLFPNMVVGRSLYANYYQVGGVEKPDCKVYQTYGRPNANLDFLSTMDATFRSGEVGRMIKQRFKEKSIYEL